MSPPPSDDRWSSGARRYDDVFAPRWRPWFDRCIRGLCDLELPDGHLVVPCCGSGFELPLLADAFPGRRIVGVDLAAGMLELAAGRCRGEPSVELVQADATKPPRSLGGAAVVASWFGYQLFDDRRRVLRAWASLLASGGALSVTWWPPDADADGPTALARELVMRRLPPALGGPRREPDHDWLEDAGLAVLQDRRLSYEVTYPGVRELWAAIRQIGSWRMIDETRGPALLDSVGAELRAAWPQRPMSHRPRARWILAQRT